MMMQTEIERQLESAISLERELHLGRNSFNSRVALKFEVVYLWLFGTSQGQICKRLGLSRNTVKSYIRQYQRGGTQALRMFYNREHID